MTTTDQPNKYRYQGNGVTATFAFPGRVFAKTDLVVQIITRATNIVLETLTINTDYSVTLATNGTASVTITNALKIPSNLQDAFLYRSLAQTQPLRLPTGTVFPAKDTETALDRSVALVQDTDEKISRAIKLPLQTTITDEVLVEEPVDDAILAWDLISVPPRIKNGPSATTLAGAVQTATDAADAANAAAILAGNARDAAIAAKDVALQAAQDAIGAAASVNLPPFAPGDTGKILIVNPAEDGYDLVENAADIVTYDNGSSGLSATDVQGAIDEIASVPAPASGLVYLGTAVASNTQFLTFTDLDATYDEYIFELIDLVPGASANVPYIRFSIDNGATFIADGQYQGAALNTSSAGGFGGSNQINVAYATLGDANASFLSARVTLKNPASTTTYKNVFIESVYNNSSGPGVVAGISGGSWSGGLTAVNAITFFLNGSNWTSGQIQA